MRINAEIIHTWEDVRIKHSLYTVKQLFQFHTRIQFQFHTRIQSLPKHQSYLSVHQSYTTSLVPL